MGHVRSAELEAVELGPPKGRGVVAVERIQKGQYVCEYRTWKVYPVGTQEEDKYSTEYELNDEGSFVIYTAYPTSHLGERLCFDATRRSKDMGRLINHSTKGNIKLGKPLHLRGKWRIGFVAIRDIEIGEELTYDYGVRGEEWMSGRKRAMALVGESGKEDEAVRSSGESEDEAVKGLGEKKQKQKRNYFWCPVPDCMSGPVQKMGQHLAKVHKMAPSEASKVMKKKRRATLDAIKMKLPNPYSRSSGQRDIRLFTKGSTVATPPPCEPSTSWAQPGRLATPSLTKFHVGGPFLDGLNGYLTSVAGGNRSRQSASQITRYVAKYLHYLNPEHVDEGGLLLTGPVLPYLEGITKLGVQSSGVLHRILAHKAAVHYMKIDVSWF